MREVAAEFERPVLLFSGGKDSIVLLRLAEKAFRPGRFPFPVMHIDTGHNFPEVIEFRDRRVEELGERLIVASVQESIDKGRAVEETGPRASRNRLQTVTLLDAIEEHRFDAAVRRRPPRRGARPRQGADALLPRRLRPVGPARPAPGAVEPLQRPHPPRRARPRVPALELDRARRLAVHRPRGARAAVDLLRPRARGVRARRDALRRLRARARARAASAVRGSRPLPHRRRPDGHRRRALDRRRRSRTSSPRSPPPASPSAARPAPTTASPRPRWKTASARATSKDPLRRAARLPAHRHRRLGRRRQVDADRPAALRLQGDPRRPARRVRADQPRRGDGRSTSRCSPTACAPSASRASRSTSPTATSPRRGASSSSPTRPGHVQYTRNMVTGASTADVAIVLVDARQGDASSRAGTRSSPRCSASRTSSSPSTRWTSSTGTRRVYEAIVDEIADFAAAAGAPRRRRSSRSPRCTATTSSSAPTHAPGTAGRRCCGTSSTCTSPSDRNLIDVRFPVQWVIRPQTTSTTTTAATPARWPAACCKRRRRGGRAAVGRSTRIARIETFDGPVDEAFPPMSVTVHLEDDLDVSRGDLICRPHNHPQVARELDATICWMTRRRCGRGALPASSRRPARARDRDAGIALPARRQHAAPRRATPSSGSTTSAASRCAPARR